MTIDIDKLEALAKAAQAHSDNIGEQDWYEADEISSLAHGLIAKADVGLMAGCTPETILALIAEVRALREDAERWRTEMALRNDPAVAIMFAGTEQRCAIYRNGELFAAGATYAEAIEAARKEPPCSAG